MRTHFTLPHYRLKFNVVNKVVPENQILKHLRIDFNDISKLFICKRISIPFLL